MGTYELSQLWSKLNDVVTEYDEKEFIHEIEYDNLFQYDKNIINIINIILNSLFCLSCVYVLKISWWLMPIAFIITDAVLSALEFIVIYLQNKKINLILTNVKSIDKYIMKLEEQQKSYENKYLKKSKKVGNHKLLWDYKNKCNIICIKIEKLKQIKAAQEKEMKNEEILEEDIIISKADMAIKKYKALIELIERNGSSDTRIQGVLRITKLLLTEVEKNKSSYSIVADIFNIYFLELIETIKEVDKLNEINKDKYIQRMNILIDNYYSYVERAIEQVKGYNTIDIDVRINTLLSELNKVGEINE